MHPEITNHFEAFTLALVLSITAPTDAQADLCLKMAEDFAPWLTAEEIAKAKAQALIEVGQWESEQMHGRN